MLHSESALTGLAVVACAIFAAVGLVLYGGCRKRSQNVPNGWPPALNEKLSANSQPTTEQVLGRYCFHDLRAQESEDWVAYMGFFILEMQEVGPPAVPGLRGIVGVNGVNKHMVFSALRHIDEAWNTNFLVETLLVSRDLDPQTRLEAVGFVSRACGRAAVAYLRKTAEDPQAGTREKALCDRTVQEILGYMVGSPSLRPEDRQWAKTQLERFREYTNEKE